MDQPRGTTSESQCNRLYHGQPHYEKSLALGDTSLNKLVTVPPQRHSPQVYANGNSHHLTDGRDTWPNPEQLRFLNRHGMPPQSVHNTYHPKQTTGKPVGIENFVNNVNFSQEEVNWLRQQNFNALHPVSSHLKSTAQLPPRHVTMETSHIRAVHQGHSEYQNRSQQMSPNQTEPRIQKTFIPQNESRYFDCSVRQGQSTSAGVSYDKNKYGSGIKLDSPPAGHNFGQSDRGDNSNGQKDEHCLGHEASKAKYGNVENEYDNYSGGKSDTYDRKPLEDDKSHTPLNDSNSDVLNKNKTEEKGVEVQTKKAKAKFHMKISLRDNKVSLSEELRDNVESEMTDENLSSNTESKDDVDGQSPVDVDGDRQKKRQRKQTQTRRIPGVGEAIGQENVKKRGRRRKSSQVDGLTDEKLFECTICYKQVKSNLSLKLHLQTHAGIKPHKCSECGKCFTQVSSLKTHMRKHTGETPFKCDTCEKAFSVRLYLQAHMRVHTGDRPFECIRCGNKFTQASSLRTHQKKNCRSGI